MSEGYTDQTWEPAEIDQGLRQLPATIAKKSQEVIEAQKAVSDLEHLIRMVEADVRVKYLGQKYTSTDIKAIAYAESEPLHKQMLGLVKELELQKARLAYLRDMFDSCRKAATLRIEEARRLEGTVSRRIY